VKQKTQKSQNLKEHFVKLSKNLTQNIFLKIQTQLKTKQQINLIKFYTELTNYLALFYDLTNKNQTQNKYLGELLEQLLFNQSNNENSFLLIIRLKYAYKLLSSENNGLFQLCEKRFQNFEHKLFNMAVNYYLIYDDNTQKQNNIVLNDGDEDDVESDDEDSRFIEFYFKYLFEKFNFFKQLNIKFQSNIELMLNDLIFKYSFRFKLIEVRFYLLLNCLEHFLHFKDYINVFFFRISKLESLN
jgi:hypothetical protein